MKVIIPHSITAANVTAKSIATEATYSSSSAYSEGDEVLGSDSLAYQFIGPDGAAGNHADPVTDGQTDWVFLGPPNYLRPFDQQIGVDQDRVIETVATDANEITYTIDSIGTVWGAAFLNLRAVSVRLFATESVEGDIYDETYTLDDNALLNSSMFRFLTYPIDRQREYVLSDLNFPSGSEIGIEIANTGGTAQVGAIVLGRVEEFGVTGVDAKWSSSSRSFIQFDGFKTSIVRRFPASRLTAEIKIPTGSESSVRRRLEDLEGVPAVFIVDENKPEYTVYGVFTSAVVTGRAKDHAFLSLTVETI